MEHIVQYRIEAVDKITSLYKKLVAYNGTAEEGIDAVNAAVVRTNASMQSMTGKVGQVMGALKEKMGGVVKRASVMTGSMRTSIMGMASLAGGALAAVGVTVQAVGKYLGDSVEAAGALNDANQKAQNVFGDSYDRINDLASTSSKMLGMSKKDVFNVTSEFGQMFKSFGYGKDKAAELSEVALRLTGDLSSFNGMSMDESAKALQSALGGSKEAAAKFGVQLDDVSLQQKALSMGLVKNTNTALSEAIKKEVIFASILDKTKDAHGHLAKNMNAEENVSKRLAAASEDLKAKIGQGLLPVKAKLNELLLRFVEWASRAVVGIQKFGAVLFNFGSKTAVFFKDAIDGTISYIMNKWQQFKSFMSFLGQWLWNHHPMKWMIDLVDRVFPNFSAKVSSLFEKVKGIFLNAGKWIYDNVLKRFFGWLSKFGFDFNITGKAASLPSDGGGNAFDYDKVKTTGIKDNNVGVKNANAGLVSGGGKEVKTINIRIEKLVESLNINTQQLGMSTSMIKSEIERILLSAVNEVNYQ